MIQDAKKAISNAPQGITLLDVFGALLRGKWLVLGIPVLFLIPAYIFVKMKVPFYQSTSKFICHTGSSSGGGNIDLLARFAGFGGGSQGTSSDPSAYFSDILMDEDFLGKLNDRRWPHKGDSLELPAVWKIEADRTQAGWESRARASTVGILRNPKRIKLVKNRANGVFVLDTFFESPDLSREMNRHLIQLFNDYIREDLLSNTRNKRIFIEGRLTDVDAELRRNEDALTRYLERNKSIDSPELVAQRSRLTRAQSITQEIYLQLRKEYEAAKIEELKDLPLIEIISKPTLTDSPARGKERLLVPAAGIAGLLTGILLALALQLVPWTRLWSGLRGRP